MRNTLLIAATLLLSGCGIYGKFETPEQDLDGICSTIEVTDEVKELPTWDEVFVDPYLKALIDSVLARNTDIKVAALRTEEAKATLANATYSFFPSLSLSLSKPIAEGAQYSASLGSGLNVDAFGKLRNSRLESVESYNLSKINEFSVRAGLIQSTIGYYGTIMMYSDQLNYTLEDLERWKRNLATLENLKASGEISEAAYLEAKAECQILESGIVPFYGLMAVYESFLSRFLADKPNHIERGTLSDLQINDIFPEGVPVSLLSSRPDVQAAEHALAKAYYATNGARGSFYPSIYISGSAGWHNGDFSTILDPKAWITSAVASLTQPIFSHRSIATRYKIAKAELEAAQLQFTQSLLNAGSDVYLYNMALIGAKMKKEAQIEVVKTLEDALTKLEEDLERGKVNHLELISTQKTLHQAKNDLAQAYYDHLSYAVSYYIALGGGGGAL